MDTMLTYNTNSKTGPVCGGRAPYHKELVYLSGAFEIILGIMLVFETTRFLSGWGLILLLIAVFPANIYLVQTNGAAMNISPALAWGRLPFQTIFIGLAYWHSKV